MVCPRVGQTTLYCALLQLAAMQQYSIAPMGHPPLAKWATEHTQRQHNPPVATSTAITIGTNAALEVHTPACCQGHL